MWMEAVVAYFQELSQHLPEGMKYSLLLVGVLSILEPANSKIQFICVTP